MNCEIHEIAADVPRFAARIRDIPWLQNIGKSHPRDAEVVRISAWEDWPGPEKGYADWLGRYLAVVREHLEVRYSNRHAELTRAWQEIERLVMDLAIPNVPEYRADEDAWYAPTTSVWHAGYVAALVACHILVGRPLPEPVADQWQWFADGHWPCDCAESPHGFSNESLVEVPATKLVVF